MLHRIEIRDFQSLAQTELDLGQITVIVGRSRSGKSALVRALQAALFNRSGGAFVREGASMCSVTLTMDDARLAWVKPRKGGAEYKLFRHRDGGWHEDATLTRVDRDAVQTELCTLTGVREIQGEGVRARLQFDDQFAEPFLLAGTGGQAARLLARVSKLDVLVTAQVLARKDGERNRKAAVASEELAQGLRDRLAAQPDYEVLLRRWEALRERHEVLAAEQAKLVKAEALVAEVGRLERSRAAWAEKRLPERMSALVDSVGKAAETAKAIGALVEAETAVEAARGRHASAEAELVGVEEELHRRLEGLEICPLCGTVLRV